MIEGEVLSGLMKKAQKEYYQDKKITKSMYAMKMEMYTSRIEEIKAMRPVLQRELQKKKRERLEAVAVVGEEKDRAPISIEGKERRNRLNVLPEIEKKAISQAKSVKDVKKKIMNKEVKQKTKRREQKKKRVSRKSNKEKKEPTPQKTKTASPKEIEETLASLEEEFGELKNEETKKEDKESKDKKEHKPLTEFFE